MSTMVPGKFLSASSSMSTESISRWLVGLVQAEQRLGGHEHLASARRARSPPESHAHALIDVIAGEEERAQKAALLRNGPARCHRVDLLQHRVGLLQALQLMLGIVRNAHVKTKLAGTR